VKLLPYTPLLLVAACGPAADPPPNVVVIVLDTLRADRLGCYGHSGGLTPALDELAAGATLWRARSSSPWTVPSHASMFTGRDPHAHGAHSFDARTLEVDNCHPLAQEHVTLAEVLREEGFATGGVVANAAYLKGAFGLHQGFETWQIERERAGVLNREALEWIDGREEGRPWFLFLNYMDTHRPYNVEARPGEYEYTPLEFPAKLLEQLYQRVIVEGQEPGEIGAVVEAQYDRAVRNLDRALGELFDALRARGAWENTLVVVTSDHGEYFGEHDLVEHAKDVYEEALDVPLIVKAPGQMEGAVEETVLTSTHLPRLVLDTIGIGARHAQTFPRAVGEGELVAENYYSRLPDLLHPDPEVRERFRRVRTALYRGEWKLLHSSDGEHELYRLDVDPREERNLILDEPDRAGEMARALEALLAAGRYETDSTVRMDPSHREDLEGMGYAGGQR